MRRYTIQFATNNFADEDLWKQLAKELFVCYTCTKVDGVWQHTDEESYIFTLYSDADEDANVRYLARYIKETYQQDAVLYLVENVNAQLI